MCGFSVSSFQKPTKSTQKNKETQYMDDTKSNPYTLNAGFPAPLESEQKPDQERATKQQWTAMCVDTACAPMPPKPHAFL